MGGPTSEGWEVDQLLSFFKLLGVGVRLFFAVHFL